MFEVCVFNYEDMKHRREYTKGEIVHKEDEILNAIGPWTEGKLKGALMVAGLERWGLLRNGTA